MGMLRHAIGLSDPLADGSDPSVDPPTGRPSADGSDICAVGGSGPSVDIVLKMRVTSLLKNWMVMTKNVSDKPKMNHNIIWNKQ